MYLEIKSIEELQQATSICEAEGLEWNPKVDWAELIPTIESELTYSPIYLDLSGNYIYWETKEEVENFEDKGPIIPFGFIKVGLFKAELYQLLKKYHTEIWCEMKFHRENMIVYFVEDHKGYTLNEGCIFGSKELLKFP